MNNHNDFQKKLKHKNQVLTASVIDPITKKEIKFNIINKTTLWRAQTLFSKEPVTIDWIRKFEKNKILFDIGANIGAYSIYSAINSLVNVYSFEPESNNFQVLMQNIIINNLINKIQSYQIGISNKTEFTNLHLSNFSPGESHHSVGENALGHNNLKKINREYKQGIFSTTLDDLCFKWGFPIPNYIKIDVDGIENKIIDKSVKTISNPLVESILIEINENREEDRQIIKILKKIGFQFNNNQVAQARRKSGSHKDYAEYLFYK